GGFGPVGLATDRRSRSDGSPPERRVRCEAEGPPLPVIPSLKLVRDQIDWGARAATARNRPAVARFDYLHLLISNRPRGDEDHEGGGGCGRGLSLARRRPRHREHGRAEASEQAHRTALQPPDR